MPDPVYVEPLEAQLAAGAKEKAMEDLKEAGEELIAHLREAAEGTLEGRGTGKATAAMKEVEKIQEPLFNALVQDISQKDLGKAIIKMKEVKTKCTDSEEYTRKLDHMLGAMETAKEKCCACEAAELKANPRDDDEYQMQRVESEKMFKKAQSWGSKGSQGSRLDNANHYALAHLLLVGGFVYFSRENGMIKTIETVKSIAPCTEGEASDDLLCFGKWYTVSDEMVDKLKERKKEDTKIYGHSIVKDTNAEHAPLRQFPRLQTPSLPRVRRKGIEKFTWVGPAEEFNGETFSYGGFVYTFKDGATPCIVPIQKRANVLFNPKSELLRSTSLMGHTGGKSNLASAGWLSGEQAAKSGTVTDAKAQQEHVERLEEEKKAADTEAKEKVRAWNELEKETEAAREEAAKAEEKLKDATEQHKKEREKLDMPLNESCELLLETYDAPGREDFFGGFERNITTEANRNYAHEESKEDEWHET